MSEKIRSFVDLHTWQEGHKLVIALLSMFDSLSRSDALRNQIERSAISITSNIAEGFGRQSSADKRHFYVVARGSAFEVQNRLLIARDIKKISPEQYDEISELLLNAIRLLHGLIRSLDRSQKLIANS